MMAKKRFLIVAVLLLLLSFSVTAADGVRIFFAPSVSVNGGLYNSIPLTENLKRDYVLPSRSQIVGTVDLGLLSFRFSDTELHTGPLFEYVTNSSAWGTSIVNGFWAIGYGIGGIQHFTNKLTLGLSYRLMYFKWFDLDYKGAAHEIVITPEWIFKSTITTDYALICPVQVQYRGNVLGVTITAGIRITYNKIMKAPLWLLEQQRQQEIAEEKEAASRVPPKNKN